MQFLSKRRWLIQALSQANLTAWFSQQSSSPLDFWFRSYSWLYGWWFLRFDNCSNLCCNKNYQPEMNKIRLKLSRSRWIWCLGWIRSIRAVTRGIEEWWFLRMRGRWGVVILWESKICVLHIKFPNRENRRNRWLNRFRNGWIVVGLELILGNVQILFYCLPEPISNTDSIYSK